MSLSAGGLSWMADSSNCSMARMNFGWAAINSLRAASSFPALSLTGFGADSLEERVLRNGLRRWRYSWYSWLVQASFEDVVPEGDGVLIGGGCPFQGAPFLFLLGSFWSNLYWLNWYIRCVCFPVVFMVVGGWGSGGGIWGIVPCGVLARGVEGAGPFGSAWGWFSRFSWFPRRTFGRRTFGGVGIRRLACYGAKLGLMDSLGCW